MTSLNLTSLFANVKMGKGGTTEPSTSARNSQGLITSRAIKRVPSHFDEIIRKSCMKAGTLNINSSSMDYKSMNLAEIQKDKLAKANTKISSNSNMYKNTSKFEYKGKSMKI
jgi:hypothetical protein